MSTRYKRPATPEERAERDAAREAKLTALHEQLVEQVAALHSGEDWQAWLKVASRFHNYSAGNVFLIMAQQPDATAVAGYQAWKALGRQVTKGQRSIQILAPVIARRPREGEEGSAAEPEKAKLERGEAERDKRQRPHAGEVVGYRPAHVWDVSRTSGEPLPERPMPVLLAGEAPVGLWDALAAVVAEQGFALERGDCGGANGWTDFRSRTVRVRADVDDAQAVRTLAHEIGHVFLHSPGEGEGAGTTRDCRGVREVEAESTAYLVATAHGMDTAAYTFPYVTAWASRVPGDEPSTVVLDTARRVVSTANTVLHATLADDGTVLHVAPELAAAVAAGKHKAAALRDTAEATWITATAPAQVTGHHSSRLIAAHASASDWYVQQLQAQPADSGPRAYLASRGVDPTLTESFQVGYAPGTWTGLTGHLRESGFTDGELLAAGLAFTSSKGTIVDRFRDRIMFPIRDEAGHPVGFLGRAAPGAGADVPKYLNTAATPVFSKSRSLFGLAEAARALEGGAVPVLTEGPLDALAVTSAGRGRYSGIALAGTALTAEHVAALDRSVPLAVRGVVVALDSDIAGQNAALSTWPLLRQAEAWPVLARFPEGSDPADVSNFFGTAALRSALDESAAHPLADAVIDRTIQARLGAYEEEARRSPSIRVAALRDVAPVVAGLPVEQVGRQVARLAHGLSLDVATVTGEVADAVSRADDARGRCLSRDRRSDLDRGQGAGIPMHAGTIGVTPSGSSHAVLAPGLVTDAAEALRTRARVSAA